LKSRDATIDSTTAQVRIDFGYIIQLLLLHSPAGTMLMNNEVASTVPGVTIQLYQPTHAFAFVQDGDYFTTNAYVTQYAAGALPTATNYQQSRSLSETLVYTRSAAMDADRYAAAVRRAIADAPSMITRAVAPSVAIERESDDDGQVNWGQLLRAPTPETVLIDKRVD
jgi:hypothetical protein